MNIANTVPAMFLEVCKRFEGSTKVAYSRKINGEWSSITHDELRRQVELFAKGLSELGISAGDRVGIVSENRVEWVIADFAITGMKGIDVPIFPTLTARQAAYIYNDCGARCVVVSNKNQLKKILSVRGEIPTLETIIVMNDDVEPAEGVVSFSDVLAKGEASCSDAERREWFATRALEVAPDDMLTLIYTSGTTGNPKGVILSHKNLMSNIAGALQIVKIDETDVFLSYLPMCHSYERMTGYYLAFAVGTSTYIADSIETVAENMREVRPTVMTSVPRLFERIKARVEGTVHNDSPVKQQIFHWAVRVGIAKVTEKTRLVTNVKYAIADALVFKKIRARTGGRLRFFVSGGAALSFDVGMFFKAVGLRILEGYGLTETSPVLCFNREGEEELGTVGKPIPNVEIRIADDGEILAKGPNIMLGYWNNPEATSEAIDSDGWLRTGDVGYINAHGHLVITDRKKHILVSSGGKNIAPAPIEAAIAASPLIDQVILIGDNREFCTALIVPDKDGVEAWAKSSGVEYTSWTELVASVELFKAMETEVMHHQGDISKYERVRRFRLLPAPFSVDNGMLTPTLKIKRKAVTETYANEIEQMYA